MYVCMYVYPKVDSGPLSINERDEAHTTTEPSLPNIHAYIHTYTSLLLTVVAITITTIEEISE